MGFFDDAMGLVSDAYNYLKSVSVGDQQSYGYSVEEIGKPFIVVVNSTHPSGTDTIKITEDIKNKYSFVDLKDIPYSVNREVLNRKYTRSKRKF